MTTLKNFARDESGATAIEYGLIAGGISVGIIALVYSIGGKIVQIFTTIDSELQ